MQPATGRSPRVPVAADVAAAADRIAPLVRRTPIVTSSLLNRWLGHEFYFKAECLQQVGAFKARGASNAVARLCEGGPRPRRIVANSSGNHAQAVAWAAQRFGLPARIYMPAQVSPIKAAATREYGAEVVLCPDRAAADGAMTLSVGDLTFGFIRQADHFYEVEEERIAYWFQWLTHLLKLRIEPTSALAMAAAVSWLAEAEAKADAPRRVLVILSGGNVASDAMRRLYARDYTAQRPGR